MEKAQPAGVMGVENRSETRRLDAPAATLTITKMTKPATSRHRSRIKGPEMVNFHDLVAGLLAAAASEVGAGVAIFAFALLACWKGRREERCRWRWRLKAMKTTKRNKKNDPMRADRSFFSLFRCAGSTRIRSLLRRADGITEERGRRRWKRRAFFLLLLFSEGDGK